MPDSTECCIVRINDQQISQYWPVSEDDFVGAQSGRWKCHAYAECEECRLEEVPNRARVSRLIVENSKVGEQAIRAGGGRERNPRDGPVLILRAPGKRGAGVLQPCLEHRARETCRQTAMARVMGMLMLG